MLTAEQYDQSAVNFSQALLREVQDGTQTLETLQQEREQAIQNRNWVIGQRSYVVEGYNQAIAQLTAE